MIKQKKALLLIAAIAVMGVIGIIIAQATYSNSIFTNSPARNSSKISAVRTIRVVSSDAAGFTPDVIRLKYGDTVRFVFSTKDEAHSFTLPGYRVNQFIPRGKTTELTFHATKKGTFTFYCAVPCRMLQNSGILIIS